MYNYIVTAKVKSTSVKFGSPLYAIDFKLAPIFCTSIATIKNANFRVWNTLLPPIFWKIRFLLQNQILKFQFQLFYVKTKCSLLYPYFNRFQNVGVHIMEPKQFKTSFLLKNMLIVVSTTYLVWTLYFITNNFQDFELTE